MLVKKTYLFIIAGLLWVFAGTMVMKLGLEALFSFHPWWSFILSLVIYLTFYLKVFSKLVKKHEDRIMNNSSEVLPLWSFFDKKSYIIMFSMMGMGILLRELNILPSSFISFFYTGLGLALFSCGLRFLYLYFKYLHHKGVKNAPNSL